MENYNQEKIEKDFEMVKIMLTAVEKKCRENDISPVSLMNGLCCMMYCVCDALGTTPIDVFEEIEKIGFSDRMKEERERVRREKK